MFHNAGSMYLSVCHEAQALASNPLQAAAVGNVAVVSVAERYVLLSGTQVNVFVKPDEQ